MNTKINKMMMNKLKMMMVKLKLIQIQKMAKQIKIN